jgi:hypothetical protein
MKLPMTPPVRLSLPGKRVCFWGAPAEAPLNGAGAASWRGRIDQTGGNTGNLFIGHGLYHHVDALTKAYHPGFDLIPSSAFDENFDYLMIPASNFINPALDLESIYNYFRKTKAPICCFGLGSQVIPGKKVVLKPGTEAFLKLLSERSETIGVRGAFTADVLWSMGIKNISLTGCPSMLGLSEVAIAKLASSRPSLEKVAINYSNNVRGHSFNTEAHTESENNMFRYFMKRNSFYVLQNEASELALLDAMAVGDSSAVRDCLTVLAQIFKIDQGDLKEARSYFETRLRVFFETPTWMSAMSTMTATVGTRFHGNVASILAGTAGLVLVHDMRTLELAELFEIPHLLLNRPYAAEEIVERLVSLDYVPFLRRMNLLRGEWRAFAVRNGIGID